MSAIYISHSTAYLQIEDFNVSLSHFAILFTVFFSSGAVLNHFPRLSKTEIQLSVW